MKETKRSKRSKRRVIIMTVRRICVVAAFAVTGICYVSGGEDEIVIGRDRSGGDGSAIGKEEVFENGEVTLKNEIPEKETTGDTDTLTSDGVKININTASEQELTTLNGIGPSKARKIIGFRAEHGAFASKEELMLVPGIKEGTFSKIKDSITVG